MSIELVMPSNHLILYCPLLLLPSILPGIRVFSNESVLCIRRPKYSCSIVALKCYIFTVLQSKSAIGIYVFHFLKFPSHLGHHSALSRVPCATQCFSLFIYFVHSIKSVYLSIQISQFLSPPWYPYICSLHLCLHHFCRFHICAS